MDILEQQVADGERAGYAMEYLGPKFDQLDRELFELLAEVNMHDKETQAELLRSIKNLRKLRGLIDADIANANLARDLIKRSVKDRIRGVVGF